MSANDSPGISRVVFGAMWLPRLRRPEQQRLLHCAIDHGITSIDTAPLYFAGESEKIVGEAIADRRDTVQILTKCGLSWAGDFGAPMFTMNVNGLARVVRKDSRPQSILSGIDQSLRRLNTETIDLIHVHQFDNRTSLDDLLAALEKAQQAGKIRAIGVSNFPLYAIEQAHMTLREGLFSVQDRFNLLDRSHSAEIRVSCEKSGIAFLAYSPLAQGTLAGKPLRKCNEHARASRSWHQRRIERALEAYAVPLAKSHGVSVSTICLAWTLKQHGVTHVVAGASTEQQCSENGAAASLIIDEQDLKSLDDALASITHWSDSRIYQAAQHAGRRLKRAARKLLDSGS